MEDVLLKLASDSVLLLFLIAAMYFLRPVLQRYLDQQIQQLTKLTELVGTLSQQQETFADRLEHVEDLLGIIAAGRATPASLAAVTAPSGRTRRKRTTDDAAAE